MLRVKFFGTGRCGTRYAAVSCQAAGLDVGHEKIGKDGVSSCRPDHVVLEADTSVLLARDPLTCVASLTTVRPFTFSWFSRACTDAYLGDDVVRMACEHYAKYNLLLLRSRPDFIEQIEILDLERLGLPSCPIHLDPVNRRKHCELTRETLKRTQWGREALRVGQLLGYDY